MGCFCSVYGREISWAVSVSGERNVYILNASSVWMDREKMTELFAYGFIENEKKK